MFMSEYENDPVGREKVDHSGKRKDNQMSKILEKVRERGKSGVEQLAILIGGGICSCTTVGEKRRWGLIEVDSSMYWRRDGCQGRSFSDLGCDLRARQDFSPLFPEHQLMLSFSHRSNEACHL